MLERFSDPKTLENNIIWHNRSFYVDITTGTDPRDYTAALVPDIAGGDAAVYDDLGVLGTVAPESMSPTFSILTGYPSCATPDGDDNCGDDPDFLAGYSNQYNTASIIIGAPASGIDGTIAFDGGGNYIDLRYSPLTLSGNYHIDNGSPAEDAADSSALDIDFDLEQRPAGDGPDIGADERQPITRRKEK